MAEGTVLAEILLSGDRSFRRSIESAGDSLDDTARDAGTLSGALSFAGEQLSDVSGDALEAAFGLGRVAAQADDAGDELVGAGGKAAAAGGLFGTASVGTNGLNFSLVSLSGAITGVAIPALAALSTTLVPLTATLSGFAAAGIGLGGAFSAVVGSGALAYGQDLNKEYQEQLLRVKDQIEALEEQEKAQGSLTDAQRKELKQLKDRKQELDDVEGAFSALQVKLGDVASEVSGIVAEWGSGFAPLIRDGINAIPRLVRSVLDAVGGLSEFQSGLRTIGGIAMDVLPSIAGTLADVGREALPIFIDGLRWLQENGGGIFDSIMQTTRTVAPLLQDVASAFVDILPTVNKIGTTILTTLLPPLSDGIDYFGNLLDQIIAFTQSEEFAEIMRAAGDAVRELAPEVKVLARRIGGLAGTQLQAFIENAPEFIRLGTQIADALLDIGIVISKYVIPPLKWLIKNSTNALGTIAGGVAGWMGRSQEAGARADSFGEAAGMWTDAFRITGGEPLSRPSKSARRAALSEAMATQRRGAEPMQIDVSGKLREEDGEIVAVIDDRVETKQEQKQRNATNRGFARQNFSR